MVDARLRAVSVDIVTEPTLTYRQYLRPLLAAASFISGIPVALLSKPFAANFIRELAYFFPYEATRLLYRFWVKFTPPEQLEYLDFVGERLRHTQNFDVGTVLCQIVFQRDNDSFGPIKAKLREISSFAVANPGEVTERQLSFYRAFEHFVANKGQGGDPDVENAFARTAPRLFRFVFGKDPYCPPASAPATLRNGILFTPMDPATLRNGASRDLSLVKSQLRAFNAVFSIDELESLFHAFCAVGDGCGARAVLQFAVRNNLTLPLRIHSVPQTVVAPIMGYLSQFDPARARATATTFFSGNWPTEVQLAAIRADHAGFLAEFDTKERLTKRRLHLLALAIPTRSFDPVALAHTVVAITKRELSVKKLPYVMLVVINSLAILRQISEPLINAFLTFFSARRGDLIPLQVARALLIISSLAASGPHVVAITRQLTNAIPLSPESVVLFRAISRTIGKDLFETAVSRDVPGLLASSVPSSFCGGLRLLVRGLQQDIPEGPTRFMLRSVLAKLIDNFPRFVHLPSVSEIAGAAWLMLLSLSALREFRGPVLAAFDRLIPMPSRAAFPAASACLVPALSISAPGDKAASHITAIEYKLIVAPVSIFLLRIFLRIIAASPKSAVLPEIVERLATGAVLGYTGGDAVFEMIRMVAQHAGPQRALVIVRNHFLGKGKPFWPIFLGVARMVKHLEKDETKEAFVAEVMEIGKELPCKAHSEAMAMLGDKERVREAILLALSEDAEEQDDLLRGKIDGPRGDWVGQDENVTDWPVAIG
jgi:hypothetical protein